jgi:hypothetical protein
MFREELLKMTPQRDTEATAASKAALNSKLNIPDSNVEVGSSDER